MAVNASPSAFKNTLIISGFEVKKLFTQPRGIIALTCFSLLWALILLYPIRSATDLLLTDEFRQFILGFAQMSGSSKLLNWVVAEMSVYWLIALYLFPMFSLIITADQFSSDKQRGTLRFLLLRTSRDSIFFGRFFAHMIIQSILIFISVIATIVLAVYRDPELLAYAVTTGTQLLFALLINLLPYTALMATLSLHAKSARQASLLAVLYWVLATIFITIIHYYLPAFSFIEYIKPGVQIADMINSYGKEVFNYSVIPVLQAGIFLVLGRTYMQRISL
ncbi:MAG: ABC transporter permease subunit [Parashewanella sp.]